MKGHEFVCVNGTRYMYVRRHIYRQTRAVQARIKAADLLQKARGWPLFQHVSSHVERKLVLLINPHPRVTHEIHSVPAATSEQ